MRRIMNYTYVEKIGGTDNGIHLVCPKCKSTQVIIHVLEEGHYGVEECKECGFKDSNIRENLNGRNHK